MTFGYSDPAAGGMIMHTIVAAAAALPFVLRARSRHIVDRAQRNPGARRASPARAHR
jgi:hypothetical protein